MQNCSRFLVWITAALLTCLWSATASANTADQFIANAKAAADADEHDRAIKLYREACDAGALEGCSRIGFYMRDGEHLPKDETAANIIFADMCSQGELVGCGGLGHAYYFGLGFEKDVDRSIPFYLLGCGEGAGHLPSCHNLGLIFSKGEGRDGEELARAEELYAFACAEKFALSCNNLGLSFQDGTFRNAWGGLDRAAAVEFFQQGCDLNLAKSCDLLVGAQKNLTLYLSESFEAEAVPIMVEVLRQQKRTLGERHPDTLATIHDYAALLRNKRRFEEAETVLAEALGLRREVLGERHPDTLTSLHEYANLLAFLGRLNDSTSVFAEVLGLRQEALGESHSDTMRSRSRYHEALKRMGRFGEAATVSSEMARLALARLDEGDSPPVSVLSLHTRDLIDAGLLEDAEQFFVGSLRRCQSLSNSQKNDCLATYGYLLESMGRYDEALIIYDEVGLEIGSLRVLIKLGHTEEVKSLVGALWGDSLALQGDETFEFALLSTIYASFLDDELAEETLVHAQSVFNKTVGPRHADSLINQNTLARHLDRLGRFSEAEPLFAETLLLRREMLGDDHPETLESFNLYAEFLSRLGRYSEAVPLARKGVHSIRDRIAKLSIDGSKAESQEQREYSGLQQRERFLADLLWSSSEQRPPEKQEAFIALQNASARSASRAVAEAAAARYANEQELGDLVRERQNLSGEWRRVEAVLIERLTEGDSGVPISKPLQERTLEIETRMQAIDDQLRSEAPQYFAILNLSALDLDAADAMLRSDEAVLLIVPTERGTHVMALTTEGLEWTRAELNDEDIAGAVRNLRNGLEVKGEDLPYFDLVGAHDLYEALIAPVESSIEGKKRLYVVADGELSRLPLGVLVTTKPPANANADDPPVLRSTDWLSDRFALVQLPSLQSLAYIRTYGATGDEGPTTNFMGFGDPVLEGTARLRGARSGTISPVDAASLVGGLSGDKARPLMNPAALRTMARLPGTVRELEDVRSALPSANASLFLGASMTETTIRSADLSNVDILHLATHGLTSEESGLRAEPGLVFTPPTTATAQDDGYLSASEVVGLDLTSADWIIMSACNTASPSGKAGESGLSGLSRAFFYAGAPTLLVSHWPVFDDVAAKLTVGALTRAEGGMPRAEALQAAMKEIRDDKSLDAAHPAVWAPFTLVGEGK